MFVQAGGGGFMKCGDVMQKCVKNGRRNCGLAAWSNALDNLWPLCVERRYVVSKRRPRGKLAQSKKRTDGAGKRIWKEYSIESMRGEQREAVYYM